MEVTATAAGHLHDQPGPPCMYLLGLPDTQPTHIHTEPSPPTHTSAPPIHPLHDRGPGRMLQAAGPDCIGPGHKSVLFRYTTLHKRGQAYRATAPTGTKGNRQDITIDQPWGLHSENWIAKDIGCAETTLAQYIGWQFWQKQGPCPQGSTVLQIQQHPDSLRAHHGVCGRRDFASIPQRTDWESLCPCVECGRWVCGHWMPAQWTETPLLPMSPHSLLPPSALLRSAHEMPIQPGALTRVDTRPTLSTA